MRRQISSAALAAVILFSPTISSSAQDALTLRVATPFSQETLDPTAAAWFVHGFGIGEYLMRFDPDGEFRPWLLDSLTNVDPLTWTMTLREGITFQNGKPLDAAAVVAAVQYQLENYAGARGAVPSDASFEATGPLEITFTSAEPFAGLPGVLAHRLMFPMFDAEAAMAGKAAGSDFVGEGLFTGPYAVETLSLQGMTASRNETYWQGTPRAESLQVQFVPDMNASVLAVQNGEIDISLWVPSTFKAVVDATSGINYTTTTGTDSYMAYLNVAEPPFDDVRVRKAFMLGIDYEELARDALGGTARPATSFYAPLFPFAVNNQRSDPAEAARLLDEAGWTMGSNGIRQKDGAPLAIKVLYNSGVGDLVPLSNAVQFQLRKVGFDLQALAVDDGYSAYDGAFEWNAGFNSDATWGSGLPENFLYRYLTSAGDRNFNGYDNPEIAQIAADLPRTVDPEARTALLHRVQEIMIEEDPGIFLLAFYDQGAVVSDAFSDYHPGFALQFIDWQTGPNQ
jgi:peptide/nickel transport system substrate-binding protein